MKNKKNGILFVVGSYYPEITGGGVQTQILVETLRKKFNCFVLTTTTKKDLKKRKNIYRIFYNGSILYKILGFMEILFYLIKSSKKFNSIYLRGFTQKVFLIILVGKILNKKIIYSPTRYREDDLKSLRAKYPVFYKIFNLVDRIFYMSKALNQNFNKNIMEQYLPNFVNKNKFSIKKKKSLPTIISVGFFSKTKNTKLTYLVWKKLFLNGFKSHLLLIGKYNSNYYLQDNKIYNYILTDSETCKIHKYIRIIGETKKISQYYQLSNIFVLPSTTEGFAGSILEAMISKNAVIITDLKGTHDIWNNKKNCLKIKKNSFKDYYYCLRFLIKNKSFREKLATNGYNIVKKNFDINSIKNQILIERLFDQKNF